MRRASACSEGMKGVRSAQPQRPPSGTTRGAIANPARLYQHHVRRTQSAAAFTSVKQEAQAELEDAKAAGRRRAIPRPSSHVARTYRGTSSLGCVVGNDIDATRFHGIACSSGLRPGSAHQQRQQNVAEGGSGGLSRRRPAHIQALEWERVRSKPGEAGATKEQTFALARVHQVSAEICDALLTTASRVDFAVLDRAATSCGDKVLCMLRDCLGKLASHVFSFFTVALASQAQLLPPGPGQSEAASNIITCKGLLVLLRAYAGKLPCQQMNPDDAVELSSVLDAGLSEQTLSWCSETISCYSVVYDAFRAAPSFSKPPLAAPGGSGSFRRRIANTMSAQKELDAGAKLASTDKARSTEEEEDGRQEKIDRGARMHKFRPPYLLIPETSFERKNRRGK